MDSSKTADVNLRPRVAGIMTVRNDPGLCDSLASLRRCCDTLIVLDDHSLPAYKDARGLADEIVRLEQPNGAAPAWNDLYLHGTLVWRAFVHGCAWCLRLDTDETLDRRLDLDGVHRLIEQARRAGQNSIEFPVRELWTPDGRAYRSDGVWGTKRRVSLFQNWFMMPPSLRSGGVQFGNAAISQRYHRAPAPDGVTWFAMPTEFQIFHWAMTRDDLRRKRHAKWTAIDPRGDWQFGGYDYMLDERGLTLTATNDAC